MRRRLIVFVLCCACRPERPAPVVAEVDATPQAGTAKPGTAPPEVCSLVAGDGAIELRVGELQRRYLVHVGRQLSAPPAVVFAWHGFGSGPESARRSMAGARLWDDAIVVAPQGEPRTFEQFGNRARAGWQVAKGELDDRDLAFFDAMIVDLQARGCLDPHRVYSTGFSNGGFFTNLLGCYRNGVLAAIAPAGGGGPFEKRCEGPVVPALVTHGRKDRVVDFAMAERSFVHWAAHDGCSAGVRAPTNGCVEATGCSAPVHMCALPIGHEWPEGQTERTTEFLRAFTRP